MVTMNYFRATFSTVTHSRDLHMTVAAPSANDAAQRFADLAKSTGFTLVNVDDLGSKVPNLVLGVFR